MNFYFAGAETQRVIDFADNLLFSYYHLPKTKFPKIRHKLKGKSCILDSGAFSVWNKGVSIDVYDYIDFVAENLEFFDEYVMLDVVGDVEQTIANLIIMESKGLKPMPVWNWEQPLEQLEDMSKSYDRICIGGVAIAHKDKDAVVRRYLDIHERYIANTCKVHLLGFGVFRLLPSLIGRVHSVDSTTWRTAAGFGDVFTDEGKRVYKGYWEFKKRESHNIDMTLKIVDRILNTGKI
jgi:hypothetical protein